MAFSFASLWQLYGTLPTFTCQTCHNAIASTECGVCHNRISAEERSRIITEADRKIPARF